VLASEIRQRGGRVLLRRVRRLDAHPLPPLDVLVVLFPVYAFAPPRTLLSRLRRLPRVTEGRAAVIENHGMLSMRGGAHSGYGAASAGQAASILRRKGYRIAFTGGVGYPENLTIFADALTEKISKQVIDAGDMVMRRVARSLEAAAASPPRRFPIGARLLTLVGRVFFNGLASWQCGKLYIADGSCTSCGLCVKACPGSSIRLVRGRPRWGVHCMCCLGCFNTCPARAIQISIPRLLMLLLVSAAPLPAAIASFTPLEGLLNAVLPGTGSFVAGLSAALACCGAVILYGGIYLLLFFLMDAAATGAERVPALRRTMGWTYTRTLRRYAAPGFTPFSDPRTGGVCSRRSKSTQSRA
jgi:Pyruvate/2-oxoacid:ferredoxin oxidoreductase delta subunit